ncbi:N-acetylglutaminylglutamine synthetase [Granulicoccus phenolivorans]|uniref:N-acetylglutaminylglutamine synthetase n=1 Tax=Granulicoccus phenolivorans TaxID=266854 RepID=UPI00042958E8|nr:N-acetylglutaminylglutamine synthetase [Granulicoccus phenolivorans]
MSLEPGGRLDPDGEWKHDTVLDLGWGRLVFGNTFTDHDDLGQVLRDETSGRRDICIYLTDPHILVALHPADFFIDPSLTYRRELTEPVPWPDSELVRIEEATEEDLPRINRIYQMNKMVPAELDQMLHNRREEPGVTYFVARDDRGAVIGTVTAIDHKQVVGPAAHGAGLWCLAVDPDNVVPGVGGMLTDAVCAWAYRRGLEFVDLSVMYDNTPAITLYERRGFQQVPVLSVKRKNSINEALFAAPPTEGLDDLNPYARIIADEAIRRGIRVRILDPHTGYLELEHGSRTVITQESLSQYTSAVAMSRCQDKRVTRAVVEEVGVRVPRGVAATFGPADLEFLAEVGSVVVKPARGEQGAGITIGVETAEELEAALNRAGGHGAEILLEEFCTGEDLRVLVIDGKVVAAAIRRPARVIGDGKKTVRELIEYTSRRRQAATGGESRIPMDDLTTSYVEQQGHTMDEVLEAGTVLPVRRTANLHTGGTLHDVTEELHPELAKAALTSAKAIGIPVTGIDLLVPAADQPEYVFIEANERPGLANHEPNPTAQAFISYLFPNTHEQPYAWHPGTAPEPEEEPAG